MKKMRGRFADATGRRYGTWTVIKRAPNREGQAHTWWLCKCDCGNEREIPRTNLQYGKTRQCKECFDKHRGAGHPINPVFSHIRGNALSRNISFNITKEYAHEVLIKQNYKCALTGIPLYIEKSYSKGYYQSSTASLDRIDSSIGYESGNIQWVYKPINNMKWKLSQEEFIKLCKLVASHNP